MLGGTFCILSVMLARSVAPQAKEKFRTVRDPCSAMIGRYFNFHARLTNNQRHHRISFRYDIFGSEDPAYDSFFS